MENNKYCTYIRVSTTKQKATGLGLESQRKMCSDYIEHKNGVFVKEFKDVESGTHRDRPGLWAALDYCKAHGCGLVIAKLDRLARDVEFTFRVMNTGIQIYFTDMPLVNTMVLGVFATVAQYEREACSSRTKGALDAIKSDIEKNGGHMSKSGRWIKCLGRGKGADMSAAYTQSAINSQKRAQEWKNSSPLYMWVENQLLRRRPRKEILEEAKLLYDKNPSVYCTRNGCPLSQPILSLWIKDMKL